MSHALEFLNFGVTFDQKIILHEISFGIPDRGVVAIMGPGGSGKSTLLRAVSGGLDASAQFEMCGEARLAREDDRVAFVQQKLPWAEVTLFEILVDRLPNRGKLMKIEQREIVTCLLEEAGIGDLSLQLDHEWVSLTRAERSLAFMAAAAFTNPRVLCVDEPTAEIEEEDEDALLDFLARQGLERAVMMVTHNQRHARKIADYVVLIASGQLIEFGTCEQFFQNPQSEHTANFVRTGGCYVPSLNATATELENSYVTLDSLAEAVATIPPPSHTTSNPPADESIAPPKTDSDDRSAPASMDHDLDEATDLSESTENGALTVPLTLAERSKLRGRGPSGFHWLEVGALAGCPLPGIVADVNYDLDALVQAGVTHLVTLTENDFGHPKALDVRGLIGEYFPIDDMQAPKLEDAETLCARVERWVRDGGAVAFHCKAGIGRTGTMLAAQLVYRGVDAHEALNQVRQVNAKWVQSRTQEEFLIDFQNFLSQEGRKNAS